MLSSRTPDDVATKPQGQGDGRFDEDLKNYTGFGKLFMSCSMSPYGGRSTRITLAWILLDLLWLMDSDDSPFAHPEEAFTFRGEDQFTVLEVHVIETYKPTHRSAGLLR
jgi:hypothetical protein